MKLIRIRLGAKSYSRKRHVVRRILTALNPERASLAHDDYCIPIIDKEHTCPVFTALMRSKVRQWEANGGIFRVPRVVRGPSKNTKMSPQGLSQKPDPPRGPSALPGT